MDPGAALSVGKKITAIYSGLESRQSSPSSVAVLNVSPYLVGVHESEHCSVAATPPKVGTPRRWRVPVPLRKLI
jgi:hypothetical protein